jgi:CRP-like cAMP-binding protein
MLEIDLTRTERRVLDALMLSVTAGNKVRDMRYQDVANLTGVAVPHVSTAIKRLVDHDLILVVKRGEYMVNPMYVYMGTGESRPASIAIYQRLKKQAKPG